MINIKIKSSNIISFTTMQLPYLYKLYEIFYPNCNKIIPINFIIYLNPIVLAY